MSFGTIKSERVTVALTQDEEMSALELAQERSDFWASRRKRISHGNKYHGKNANSPDRQLPGARTELGLAVVMENVYGADAVARTYEDDVKPGYSRPGDIQVKGVPLEIKGLNERQWSDSCMWTCGDGELHRSLATCIPVQQAEKYHRADQRTAIVFATYKNKTSEIVYEGWIPTEFYLEDAWSVLRPDGNTHVENLQVSKDDLFPMHRLPMYIDFHGSDE